ncbi:glutathione S-transferase family protein [Reyranella sp. CPCC 100927]|uniref:glutathione S-transferase family protein n=1 Tax=Reyranella sp. CPCC 100927 TaxID=2599616 RepID=UPI0011B85DF2|nr:glutathione S-transferase family protein [Reyranella sp. CPCC 100927]TWT15608.1 glutathione S-transferase family protein [Reyranella sp. CPCC 100927]
MAEIILHHYPTSPFSEKVRIVFGLKNLAWRSVEIPVIMPKPDLMPLTGGYRRTPVLQIGADIYCDTQIILRELQKRFPERSLTPAGHEGVAEALAYWADRTLFWSAVGIVMGTLADTLPEAFHKDRSAFSGRPVDPSRMKAMVPVGRDQTYAGLAHVESMLVDGRAFLLGGQPSMADVAVYNPVWFVLKRLGASTSPFDKLPQVMAWAQRMERFGHGQPTDMAPGEALDVAERSEPDMPAGVDAGDPSGLKAGTPVLVTPDDTGKVPVGGELVTLNAYEIAVRRADERLGTVVVHFPRAGFVLAPAA